MNKKKKWLLILVPLALLLVAGLWYTRPQTLDQILSGREITDMAVTATTSSTASGAAQQDTFSSQDLEGILEGMGSTLYRVQLRSLLPSASSPFAQTGNSDTKIMSIAVLDDGTSMGIIYSGNKVQFAGEDRTIYATAENRDITDRLVSYMEDHNMFTK